MTAMKTRKVFNTPGHVHELTFSCYRRLPLLDRDRTRAWFIEALDATCLRYNAALIAYVIMPEHAHVLLKPRPAEYRVEELTKTFKQSVSRRALAWLRQHHPEFLPRLAGERAAIPGGERTRYHFWQPGGGYDRNVTNPDTLFAMIDYIHDNPVRRGLVTCPTDWPWSSARFYAGLDDVKLAMDRILL